MSPWTQTSSAVQNFIYIYIYIIMQEWIVVVEEDTDLRSTNMATQRLLSLEREKRIAAERLVEKERQALLQLRNLLSCKGIEINNKYQKEDNPTTESSSKNHYNVVFLTPVLVS